MPFIGSILPANAAPIDRRETRAERARADRKRPGEAFARSGDEADISAPPQVESAEALRSVKPNDAEESREDRTAKPYYQPRRQPGGGGAARSTLDLKG